MGSIMSGLFIDTANLTEKGRAMKTFQRMMAIFLIAAGTAGLAVACGSSSKSECLADSDCASGQLCDSVSGSCKFSCTTDTDCASGEICVTRSSNDGTAICITDTGNTTNNGTNTCNADADCATGQTCDNGTCTGGTTAQCQTADDCTGDQICTDGTCTTPTASYSYVQIADVTDTTSDKLCVSPNTNDPGADIFGVSLDHAGQTYWATSLYSDNIKATDESGNTNEHADASSVLDGAAPDLTDNCPTEGFSASVVSLGCGGSVLVDFEDASGNSIVLADGDTITVYEYGGTCQSSPSSEQDQWEVSICDATLNDVFGGTCNPTVLNSGTGVNSVTVSLP